MIFEVGITGKDFLTQPATYRGGTRPPKNLIALHHIIYVIISGKKIERMDQQKTEVALYIYILV